MRAPHDPMRSQLEHLLRAGRDEEALDYLRLSCWRRRDRWSLMMQEQRLRRRYEKAIGPIDGVPVRGPEPRRMPLGEESRLFRQCDGSSTFAAIMRRSGLDRFEAMRGLHGLLQAGLLVVPVSVTEPEPEPRPASRGRYLVLAACLLVLAFVALVGRLVV